MTRGGELPALTHLTLTDEELGKLSIGYHLGMMFVMVVLGGEATHSAKDAAVTLQLVMQFMQDRDATLALGEKLTALATARDI